MSLANIFFFLIFKLFLIQNFELILLRYSFGYALVLFAQSTEGVFKPIN
jgi:hypothetical protein